ncbi:DUF3892 domain-containing protein [Tissierella praeacuta]|uniref:DUF3892 domain-containing protein n=1 Tax=Tissierella praeacuta TaxID=43131 RepID=UPI0010D6D9B2|nr:DUF3892 domain-containing protein [Tissierella praeacuta]TCU72822.1 uncharacterized protein DUF3892 [Tissierella praeacuta]
MADYYIHAVNQEKDVIKKVKTCTSYTSSGPGYSTEKTRTSVELDIDIFKKTIYTIYKNSNGNWTLGAKVITEKVDGKTYIKTEANGKKCDNLDNIEQY